MIWNRLFKILLSILWFHWLFIAVKMQTMTKQLATSIVCTHINQSSKCKDCLKYFESVYSNKTRTSEIPEYPIKLEHLIKLDKMDLRFIQSGWNWFQLCRGQIEMHRFHMIYKWCSFDCTNWIEIVLIIPLYILCGLSGRFFCWEMRK